MNLGPSVESDRSLVEHVVGVVPVARPVIVPQAIAVTAHVVIPATATATAAGSSAVADAEVVPTED